jgi:UDP-N-acetylglucosamine 1-carboxyvinyltransferase
VGDRVRLAHGVINVKTQPMDRIQIRGGKALNGRLPISGAKNAALT